MLPPGLPGGGGAPITVARSRRLRRACYAPVYDRVFSAPLASCRPWAAGMGHEERFPAAKAEWPLSVSKAVC